MVSFYNPTEWFSVERKKIHKKRTSYSNDKFNPLIVRILAQGCRDFTDPMYLHHSE